MNGNRPGSRFQPRLALAVLILPFVGGSWSWVAAQSLEANRPASSNQIDALVSGYMANRAKFPHLRARMQLTDAYAASPEDGLAGHWSAHPRAPAIAKVRWCFLGPEESYERIFTRLPAGRRRHGMPDYSGDQFANVRSLWNASFHIEDKRPLGFVINRSGPERPSHLLTLVYFSEWPELVLDHLQRHPGNVYLLNERIEAGKRLVGIELRTAGLRTEHLRFWLAPDEGYLPVRSELAFNNEAPRWVVEALERRAYPNQGHLIVHWRHVNWSNPAECRCIDLKATEIDVDQPPSEKEMTLTVGRNRIGTLLSMNLGDDEPARSVAVRSETGVIRLSDLRDDGRPQPGQRNIVPNSGTDARLLAGLPIDTANEADAAFIQELPRNPLTPAPPASLMPWLIAMVMAIGVFVLLRRQPRS